jgi:hypothetical protein
LGRLVKDEAVRRATGLLDSVLGGKAKEVPAEGTQEQPKPKLPFDLRGLIDKKLAAPEKQ